MFCPECGTKNPDDGSFCRKCGSDLVSVSDAISGKLPRSVKYNDETHKKRKSGWESAMGKLFMGVAFLTIAGVLGVTNAIGGSAWWFWMLIPAFAMIGSGVAQTIQLMETPQYVPTNSAERTKQVSSKKQEALPPTQTDYVAPYTDKHKTGDLVPSSVVENTTRHLEMDADSETMTLPKDKV